MFILFYFIPFSCRHGEHDKNEASERMGTRAKTHRRAREGPINELYQINSFALNQLAHRRHHLLLLLPFLLRVCVCMCVFIINSMMSMPFAFRKLMLSDACASECFSMEL